MTNTELDTAVAEQVMCWHRAWFATDTDRVWADNDGNYVQPVDSWHPSTDWGDAGEVLEQTQMLRQYEFTQNSKTGTWLLWDSAHVITGRGETGPEAISRAALVWAQEHSNG